MDFDDSPVNHQANLNAVVADKILAHTVKGKQPYKEQLFNVKLPKQIPNPAIRGESVISADGIINMIKQPQLKP
ncbi:MAG: hypothetical protein LBH00_08985 [Planctomycetaceae bacterium]|nr:hypothetical protein [Planctomycetaceae bacterium]